MATVAQPALPGMEGLAAAEAQASRLRKAVMTGHRKAARAEQRMQLGHPCQHDKCFERWYVVTRKAGRITHVACYRGHVSDHKTASLRQPLLKLGVSL